jgi:hypothetical protein
MPLARIVSKLTQSTRESFFSASRQHGRDTPTMFALRNPGDFQHGQDLILKSAHGCQAQTILRQRGRLQQHIVVGKERRNLFDEGCPDRTRFGVVAVGPRCRQIQSMPKRFRKVIVVPGADVGKARG